MTTTASEASVALEWELDASRLGMWVFLATEVLFFGALFATFSVYRWAHPDAFASAAERMDLLLGSLNTAVLLTSSFTMAAAVRRSQAGRFKDAAAWLMLTWLLGAAFLVVKAAEYYAHARDRLWPGPSFLWDGPSADAGAARLFFSLYYCMTGLHALHMIVGMAAVAVVALMCRSGAIEKRSPAAVEITGLYWHFVDVVWIWLFPTLYLLRKP